MGFPFEHGLQTTVIAMRLADRLDVDRETASQTYYACLLSHAGCTTEAHVAAEVFGGSLTTHLNPRMYGSTSDVLSGLLRSLPDPERAAPVRALQTARRLPRMARGSRPALTAACEVAAMLADQTGAPTSVSGLFAHLTERWDGHGPLRREGRPDRSADADRSCGDGRGAATPPRWKRARRAPRARPRRSRLRPGGGGLPG
jgi:hypothetical protein